MHRRLALACLLSSGCFWFVPRGGFLFGFAPQPQRISWSPTPPRPPGSYHPLPVAIPLGRPLDRTLPPAPVPEPEYVPLTVPTEASVWLNGHWRWEDRWYGDGVAWQPAAGWVWAEGRWIERPCDGLDLEQPQHDLVIGGVRYLEPHWRCATQPQMCKCDKITNHVARSR